MVAVKNALVLALCAVAVVAIGCKKTKKRVYWQEVYVNPGTQSFRDAAVDANGAAYLVGTTDTPARFGGKQVEGGAGTVVVSLGPDGKQRWSLGVFDGLAAHRLALDPADGSIIVCGTAAKQVDIGTTVVPAPGDQEQLLVLAKFSAVGVHEWTRHYGGGAVALTPNIAIDAQSNIVVAGGFNGKLELGGEPLSADGGQNLNAFVAKFAADGSLAWSKSYGNGLARITAVDVDADGRVAVVGDFSVSIDFGAGPVETNAQRSAFLAVFDAAGELQWSDAFVGFGLTFATGVGFDPMGNVFAVGDFSGAIDFGSPTDPFEPSEPGGDAVFVVKRGADGSRLWNTWYDHHLQGRGRHTRAVVDGDGAVVVTGKFTQNISLAGKMLLANGDADGLVLKLTSEGQFAWARNYGEAGDDEVFTAALDPNGFVVVAGAQVSDAFVARIPSKLQ